MILDTAFFLDLIAGDENAISVAKYIEKNEIPQRVPAQVVYELYVGVGYTETPEKEAQRLTGVLASRLIIETTEAIAKRAGRMDGQLRQNGTRISVSDLLIGATAIVYEESVVTRNVQDFDRMPGVQIETY